MYYKYILKKFIAAILSLCLVYPQALGQVLLSEKNSKTYIDTFNQTRAELSGKLNEMAAKNTENILAQKSIGQIAQKLSELASQSYDSQKTEEFNTFLNAHIKQVSEAIKNNDEDANVLYGVVLPQMYPTNKISGAARKEVRKIYADVWEQCRQNPADKNCPFEKLGTSFLMLSLNEESPVFVEKLAEFVLNENLDEMQRQELLQYAAPIFAYKNNRQELKKIIESLTRRTPSINLNEAYFDPFSYTKALDNVYRFNKETFRHKDGVIEGAKAYFKEPFPEYQYLPKETSILIELNKEKINKMQTNLQRQKEESKPIIKESVVLDEMLKYAVAKHKGKQEPYALVQALKAYADFFGDSDQNWQEAFTYIYTLPLNSSPAAEMYRAAIVGELAAFAPAGMEQRDEFKKYFSVALSNAYFETKRSKYIKEEEKAPLQNALAESYFLINGIYKDNAQIVSSGGIKAEIRSTNKGKDLWASLVDIKDSPTESAVNLLMFLSIAGGLVKSSSKLLPKLGGAAQRAYFSLGAKSIAGYTQRTKRIYGALKYLAQKNNMPLAQYALKNYKYRTAMKIAENNGIKMVEGMPTKEFFASPYLTSAKAPEILRISKDIKQASSLGISALGKGGTVPTLLKNKEEAGLFSSYANDYKKGMDLSKYNLALSDIKKNVTAVSLNVNAAGAAAQSAAANTAIPQYSLNLPRSVLYSSKTKGLVGLMQNEAFVNDYRYLNKLYKTALKEGISFFNPINGKIYGNDLPFFPKNGFIYKTKQIAGRLPSMFGAGKPKFFTNFLGKTAGEGGPVIPDNLGNTFIKMSSGNNPFLTSLKSFNHSDIAFLAKDNLKLSLMKNTLSQWYFNTKALWLSANSNIANSVLKVITPQNAELSATVINYQGIPFVITSGHNMAEGSFVTLKTNNGNYYTGAVQTLNKQRMQDVSLIEIADAKANNFWSEVGKGFPLYTGVVPAGSKITTYGISNDKVLAKDGYYKGLSEGPAIMHRSTYNGKMGFCGAPVFYTDLLGNAHLMGIHQGHDFARPLTLAKWFNKPSSLQVTANSIANFFDTKVLPKIPDINIKEPTQLWKENPKFRQSQSFNFPLQSKTPFQYGLFEDAKLPSLKKILRNLDKNKDLYYQTVSALDLRATDFPLSSSNISYFPFLLDILYKQNMNIAVKPFNFMLSVLFYPDFFQSMNNISNQANMINKVMDKFYSSISLSDPKSLYQNFTYTQNALATEILKKKGAPFLAPQIMPPLTQLPKPLTRAQKLLGNLREQYAKLPAESNAELSPFEKAIAKATVSLQYEALMAKDLYDTTFMRYEANGVLANFRFTLDNGIKIVAPVLFSAGHTFNNGGILAPLSKGNMLDRILNPSASSLRIKPFEGNSWYKANVQSFSPSEDLAIIDINNPSLLERGNIIPAEIGEIYDMSSDVYSFGTVAGKPINTQGVLRGMYEQHLISSLMTMRGLSGSGLFNPDGKLIALHDGNLFTEDLNDIRNNIGSLIYKNPKFAYQLRNIKDINSSFTPIEKIRNFVYDALKPRIEALAAQALPSNIANKSDMEITLGLNATSIKNISLSQNAASQMSQVLNPKQLFFNKPMAIQLNSLETPDSKNPSDNYRQLSLFWEEPPPAEHFTSPVPPIPQTPNTVIGKHIIPPPAYYPKTGFSPDALDLPRGVPSSAGSVFKIGNYGVPYYYGTALGFGKGFILSIFPYNPVARAKGDFVLLNQFTKRKGVAELVYSEPLKNYLDKYMDKYLSLLVPRNPGFFKGVMTFKLPSEKIITPGTPLITQGYMDGYRYNIFNAEVHNASDMHAGPFEEKLIYAHTDNVMGKSSADALTLKDKNKIWDLQGMAYYKIKPSYSDAWMNYGIPYDEYYESGVIIPGYTMFIPPHFIKSFLTRAYFDLEKSLNLANPRNRTILLNLENSINPKQTDKNSIPIFPSGQVNNSEAAAPVTAFAPITPQPQKTLPQKGTNLRNNFVNYNNLVDSFKSQNHSVWNEIYSNAKDDIMKVNMFSLESSLMEVKSNFAASQRENPVFGGKDLLNNKFVYRGYKMERSDMQRFLNNGELPLGIYQKAFVGTAYQGATFAFTFLSPDSVQRKYTSPLNIETKPALDRFTLEEKHLFTVFKISTENKNTFLYDEIEKDFYINPDRNSPDIIREVYVFDVDKKVFIKLSPQEFRESLQFSFKLNPPKS